MSKHIGIVKTWNWKGYGFIIDAEDQRGIFLHYKDVVGETGGRRSVSLGCKVKFDIHEEGARTRAVNVSILARSEGTCDLPLCPVCNRVFPPHLRGMAGLTPEARERVKKQIQEFKGTEVTGRKSIRAKEAVSVAE